MESEEREGDAKQRDGIPVQLRINRVVIITTAAGEEIHIHTKQTAKGKLINLQLPSGAKFKAGRRNPVS